jgi:hypothetical protein
MDMENHVFHTSVVWDYGAADSTGGSDGLGGLGLMWGGDSIAFEYSDVSNTVYLYNFNNQIAGMEARNIAVYGDDGIYGSSFSDSYFEEQWTIDHASAPKGSPGIVLQNSDGKPFGTGGEYAIAEARRYKPGTFRTYKEAESAALEAASKYGQKHGVEFGGYIYRSGGDYTFSFRSLGLEGFVDPGRVPQGGGTLFHNHTFLYTADSYKPGDGDYVLSALRGWRDVMVNDKGEIYRYRGIPRNDFWDLVDDNGGVQKVINDQTLKPAPFLKRITKDNYQDGTVNAK